MLVSTMIESAVPNAYLDHSVGMLEVLLQVIVVEMGQFGEKSLHHAGWVPGSSCGSSCSTSAAWFYGSIGTTVHVPADGGTVFVLSCWSCIFHLLSVNSTWLKKKRPHKGN